MRLRLAFFPRIRRISQRKRSNTWKVWALRYIPMLLLHVWMGKELLLADREFRLAPFCGGREFLRHRRGAGWESKQTDRARSLSGTTCRYRDIPKFLQLATPPMSSHHREICWASSRKLQW